MVKQAGSDPVRLLGVPICEALGIDPNIVVGFTLRVQINEPVTLDVATIPDFEAGQLSEALTQITEFKIVPVEEEVPVG